MERDCWAEIDEMVEDDIRREERGFLEQQEKKIARMPQAWAGREPK